jgi:DNA-binding LacI/PurR family transcriptional regulator
MVLPDWPMDFNLRRNIEEASLALDEAGFALVTYTPHPTSEARPLWESLQPDAVVSLRGLSEEQVKAIREAGIARIVPNPDELLALEPYVEKGPALQVEHLVALGHQRILFAGSPDPRIADLVAARFAAAQAAAKNTSIGPLARVDVNYLDPGLTCTVASWRESGITAVACYNDDIAAAVVGATLRSGLSVPADLAVIGHDDIPLASMMHPQLSTIRVDTAGLGRYTAALALSAVNGSPPPLAGPEFTSALVIRASTSL